VVQVDLLHTESGDGRSILQTIDFLSPFIGTAVIIPIPTNKKRMG
jgi:hypothetical protein